MTSEWLPECHNDWLKTGRDWTDPNHPRHVFRYMKSICEQCPIQRDCHKAGEAGIFDSRGVKQGHSEGMWGGSVWRNGRPLDPDSRFSLYGGVHFERRRGLWKAEKQIGPTGGPDTRKLHLGYARHEEGARVILQDYYDGKGKFADRERYPLP